MWNSVKLRVRDLRGAVNLEKRERPVEVRGDGEAVIGVAFAHMSGTGDMFVAKSSTVGAKCSEILDNGQTYRTIHTYERCVSTWVA